MIVRETGPALSGHYPMFAIPVALATSIERFLGRR